ncbi:MAG TPA: hypothetical protein VNI61_05960, partial [Gemmatimonadales bacterium]|nr:hypothetical protein [Gemmatimonadales bacterium]
MPPSLLWDLADPELWPRLVAASWPFGLRVGSPRRTFHRDVYFDTPAGELRQRGTVCRIRYALDDRRWLALEGRDGMPLVAEARVAEHEARDILAGRSPPARRLRGLLEPDRLAPALEVEVEREARGLGWPTLPRAIGCLVREILTARRGETALRVEALRLVPAVWARPLAGALGRRLMAPHGLVPAPSSLLERAEALLAAAEGERLARAVQGASEVAVIGVAHGRLGLRRQGAELVLPVGPGSGEEGCRSVMRQAFGSPEGEVRPLGAIPPSGSRPALEVWVARRLRRGLESGTGPLQWFAPAELVTLVGSPILRDSRTLAAFTLAGRSDLLPEWSAAAFTPRGAQTLDDEAAVRVTLSELRVPTLPAAALDADRPAPEQFLNAELSWLEFNARVLALAEDPATPLLARLRFLAIFSTNLDQFFMVDVGGLKHAVASGRGRPSVDGLSPQESLDAIAIRLPPLLDRQAAAFEGLRAGPLAERGVRIAAWASLEPAAQARLRDYFAAEILPLLTPKALTRAPGHPFPFIRDRRLSLALVLRDRPGAPVHYVHLEIPARVPRFVPLGDGLRFLAVEDLVRAHLDTMFPGREVVEAHVFRITRSGDIQLDETGTSSFLQAIEEEIRRRPFGPVVRLEVEHTMPPGLRDLLRREFRFEESERQSALTGADAYASRGLMDLG